MLNAKFDIIKAQKLHSEWKKRVSKTEAHKAIFLDLNGKKLLAYKIKVLSRKVFGMQIQG